MKKLQIGFTALTAIAVSTLFAAGSAAADPHKWCAEFSGGMGSANCGFVTLEQCQATVAGSGGFCRRNLFYTDPNEKTPKPPKRNSLG